MELTRRARFDASLVSRLQTVPSEFPRARHRYRDRESTCQQHTCLGMVSGYSAVCDADGLLTVPLSTSAQPEPSTADGKNHAVCWCHNPDVGLTQLARRILPARRGTFSVAFGSAVYPANGLTPVEGNLSHVSDGQEVDYRESALPVAGGVQ